MAEQATQVDQNPTGVPTAPATAPPVASSSGHVPSQLQQQQQQQQNQQFMQQFWNQQLLLAEQFNSDFKNHPLPLARIKKVMKSDQDVKMISAEAPILFSKACEIFISEITMRAWIHAEENKRRTLQRSDVASAVTRSDQFDFLIDIVPREEIPKVVRRPKDEVVGQTAEPTMYDANVLAYYQPQTSGIQYSADASPYYPIQHDHFSPIHFPPQIQQQPQQGQQQHATYAPPSQQDSHRPTPQPPGAPQAHVPHDQQQQGQQSQQQSSSHQSHPGEQPTSRQSSSPAIKSDTSVSQHEGMSQMVAGVQHEQSPGASKRVQKKKK